MKENPDSVLPPPGKHRRPPTLSLELNGESECADCWTPPLPPRNEYRP